MRTRWSAGIVGSLLMLAACGGGTSVSTAVDDAEPVAAETSVVSMTVPEEVTATEAVEPSLDAAGLQAFFEANDWKIVAREGFETDIVDGNVSFVSVGPDLIVNFQGGLPCGQSTGFPIQWSDEGFERVPLLDPNGGVDYAFEGCDPEHQDDLLDLFRIEARGVVAEVSEDRSLVTLQSNGATLTLEPR